MNITVSGLKSSTINILLLKNRYPFFRINSLPKGSECWNFMVKCRTLINKFLTWDVGSGEEALFWEDSWEGKPPLSSQMVPLTLKSRLTECWSNKVKDYSIMSDSQDSPTWQ